MSEELFNLIPHKNRYMITEEEIIKYITNLQNQNDQKDKELEQLNGCLKEIDLIIYRLRFVEFLDRDSCIRTLDNILKDIRYIAQTGDYKNYIKRGNK